MILYTRFSWIQIFSELQMFFIDHNKRLTTFLDPRLPTDVPPINTDFLHTSLFTGRNRGARNVDDSTRNLNSVSICICPKLYVMFVWTFANFCNVTVHWCFCMAFQIQELERNDVNISVLSAIQVLGFFCFCFFFWKWGVGSSKLFFFRIIMLRELMWKPFVTNYFWK